VIPHDLHYQFPMAGYLFPLALVIFVLYWRLFEYRKTTLSGFASEKVLQDILIPRSRYNFWAKTVAFFLVWIFAAWALMQPTGNGHYPLETAMEAAAKPKGKAKEAVVKRKAHDVIFLVDASASMSVQDTRTGVSRLNYAKEIVDQIVSGLRGESTALYAFTSDTSKLSPRTMDYLFVRLILRQMRINEGDIAGTNLVEALSDMIFEIKIGKFKSRNLFNVGI